MFSGEQIHVLSQLVESTGRASASWSTSNCFRETASSMVGPVPPFCPLISISFCVVTSTQEKFLSTNETEGARWFPELTLEFCESMINVGLKIT